MKLSDYVVQFFEKQHLKDMFMVTGGGCMHLVNSFGNSTKIKYWCTQHEQAASMAAEAYSKMKNDLGLVLVTSGPGATNAITGLLGAYQDSIPCVFISGQAKRKQTVYNSDIAGLRQLGVQEVNIIPIVESISKYTVMVNNPQKIRYYLEKAVYIAKGGRPGPVWLDIPLDVQSAMINENDLQGFCPADYKEDVKTKATSAELSYFIEALKTAKRPVIIGGHGVRLAGAVQEFEKFVSQYDLPVVTPIMGIDVLSDAHQCNIGRVGTKGTRAGNFAMQNADLIISMGSRLSVSVVGHEYELFARQAKVIAIDIDAREHQKKTIELDRLIVSDVKEFLQQLAEKEDSAFPSFAQWNAKCNEWKTQYPVILPQYNNDEHGINYYKFVDVLNHHFTADMPIISDAGSAFYVVSQAVALLQGQRYITSGAIATMGFSLPAAIGVAVAAPNSTVIAITGDGSFQQNLQELEVLHYHNMNVKLFVMNNKGYFSIHQTQNKFFKGNFVGEGANSGISFPNTGKIAAAFDIPFFKLQTIAECEAQMKDILTMQGPAVIEVMLTTEQEIIPTNASLLRSDGVMVSKPLEDMYPFLPREEFLQQMIVTPMTE